jgi:hypothetical protein
MPPKFKTESFVFTEKDTVPEHIEGYPTLTEKDLTKYSIDGVDTFDDTTYAVAVDIDDLATAQLLHAARVRHIERTQPDAGSIQDLTRIVAPIT